MSQVLAAAIIAVCGSMDNIQCTDFMINCTVDPGGTIEQETVDSCSARARAGETYKGPKGIQWN